MEADVESLEIHCPGCRRAIVDICFVPNDDGGTLSIDHAKPPCEWWKSPAAKQWAISIVETAIELKPFAKA